MTTRTVLALVSALVLPGASEGSVDLVVPANPMSETAPIEPQRYGLSRDGRYVVFLSKALNICREPFEFFLYKQAYVLDRVTGETALVSHGDGPCVPGVQDTLRAQISADGSVIAMESRARNLVPGFPGGLYLYERATGTVTHAGFGSSPFALSGSGQYLAYRSFDPASDKQLVLFDRSAGTRTVVSHRAGSDEPSDGLAKQPSMSADGRFVAYVSNATDLVAGSPPGDHVYLFDRQSGLNILVARNASSPVVSANGRFVAFSSRATDLVPGQIDGNAVDDAFLFDRILGTTTLLSHTGNALQTGDRRSGVDAISEDGAVVLVSSDARNLVDMVDDAEGAPDLFLYQTGSLRLVSHLPGQPGVARGVSGPDAPYGSLSATGQLTGFASSGQAWVFDAMLQDVRSVSQPGFPGALAGGTEAGAVIVSGDGRRVIFGSTASNLGVGIRDFDGDVTLYGWEAASARVEPLSRVGSPSRAALIDEFSVSRSGRFVAFATPVANALSDPLAPSSGGGPPSLVGVLDRQTGRSELASRAGSRNVPMSAGAAKPRISGDGSMVFFQSGGALFAFQRETGDVTVVTRSSIPGVPATGELKAVSDDGRYAVFDSGDPALEADVASNGLRQVFLWSRDTGTVTMISRSALGSGAGNAASEGGSISADGSTVAFLSWATDLTGPAGTPSAPSIVYSQVYLYDRVSGAVQLVSRSSGGLPARGFSGLESRHRILSDDGRFFVFRCSAPDVGGIEPPEDWPLVIFNLYLFDRETQSLSLVSHEPGRPMAAAISGTEGEELSADGRRVTFSSQAQNLLPSPQATFSQLYLFERGSAALTLVSRASSGAPGPGAAFGRLSADGSSVAFSTYADLLTGAEHVRSQVYLYDIDTRRLSFASHSASPLVCARDSSSEPALDDHADSVFFLSGSNDLGTGLGATDLGAATKPEWARLGLFVYSPPPLLRAVDPSCASVVGGRTVRVHGAHFPNGATVTLDGVPAAVSSSTSSEIVVMAGARAATPARTGHVLVTSPGGEYATLGNAFTYAVRGDANNSGALSAADGFYLAQAVFLGGPQPASLCNGDANASGAITSADSFFLNLYLFLGGAPPPP